MEGPADIKPVVVVSQCLGFAAVRYNGQMLQDDFVRALSQHVEFVQVCPEVGIGLGVPRDPIRIVSDKGERRLVQPSTGRDLTSAMHQFSAHFLTPLRNVDGFILKSRSPSCGIENVKVFSEGEQAVENGAGLFAEAVRNRFPRAAIEDEGRLTNLRLRHHFLTRLFASARFRRACERQEISGLVAFQTEYTLQLMAWSHGGLRRLGNLVAQQDQTSAANLFERYGDELARVMSHPPRVDSICNVLQHAFGYVSKQLTASERMCFAKILEEYTAERLPLSAVLTVLQAWIVRFEQEYLGKQRFFEPYPRALMDLADFD